KVGARDRMLSARGRRASGGAVPILPRGCAATTGVSLAGPHRLSDAPAMTIARSALIAAALLAVSAAAAAPARADDHHRRHHGRHERGHHRHYDHARVYAAPGYGYAPAYAYAYAPPPVVYAPPPVVYAPPPVAYAPAGINFVFPIHVH